MGMQVGFRNQLESGALESIQMLSLSSFLLFSSLCKFFVIFLEQLPPSFKSILDNHDCQEDLSFTHYNFQHPVNGSGSVVVSKLWSKEK